MESIHLAEDLLHLAREVLEETGAPHATAALVAESLLESNLRGHDSHGIRRLVPYLEFVRDGRLDPAAEAEVVRRHGAIAIVDGHCGFGQVAARRAVDELTDIARKLGAGAAAIRNANHVGRIGEWVEALADQGLVALAFCNAEPTVAPYGGRERRLGTNPMAWAAPRRRPSPPIVMDWYDGHDARGQARRGPRAGGGSAGRRAGRRRRRAVARPGRLLQRRRAAAVRRAQGVGTERPDPARGGSAGRYRPVRRPGRRRQRHGADRARRRGLHAARGLRRGGGGVLRRAGGHPAGPRPSRRPRPR